jgi:potassium efflux system protein
MNTHHRQFFILLSLVAWCLLLTIPLRAQEKNSLDPEALLKVLTEGAGSLEREIATGKADADAVEQRVKQEEVNLQNLRARIATLKASLAAGQLQLKQTQGALKSFSEREVQIAAQLNEVREQREKLAKQLDARINAFNGLKQEVDRLRAVNHPIVSSPEVRKAYERYQQLAKQYQTGATLIPELWDKVISTLGQERQVLTEVGGDLKRYVEVGWKEELLERQVPLSFRETVTETWLALWELPERFIKYVTDPKLPGKVAASLKTKVAPLLGLLILFLILAWASYRLSRLALPKLRLWQTEMEEVGPKIIFKTGEIVVAHIFVLSFVVCLALAEWTLAVWQTLGGSIIFTGVSALVGLKIGLKLIQAVFAGKEKGGNLPLDELTARFYRRNLKLLLIYVLVLGFIGLQLLRLLNIVPETYQMLEEIIYIGFLVWVWWLLRKQYLDVLLTELPGPAGVRGSALFPLFRGLLLVVLGAIIVTSLMGFQNLSAFIAEGAALTGLAILLFWLLWQGVRAALDYYIHPEKVRMVRELSSEEELLIRYYYSFMKVAACLLPVGVLLLILKLWGIGPIYLFPFFKGLTWGVKLGPFHLTPLNLGLAVLALYLGRIFSRLFRTLLEVKFYPKRPWDEGIRYTISNTVHYTIQIFAVLMALGFLGVSFGKLAIVAGGLGVGIGFGLQNIVNNFISGLILLFERPIKMGDMLVIDGQWGLVKEIRVRSTIFQTFDRYVLIIPNSELISGKILNWTFYGPGVNRLTLKVGVSYGSDVHQVTKILDEVCRANPRVLPDPAPMIYFEAYGDSSLNFNIWVHLKSPADRIPATHELNSAIFEAFQEHGIEIPFPQRDLYVKSWPGAPSPLPLPPNSEE